MANVPFYFPFVFLGLASLLIMLGMGAGGWILARARGEKKQLSVGCMGGHGEDQHQPATEAEETKLKEEVAHLEQEVQILRVQVRPSGNGASVPKRQARSAVPPDAGR